MLPEKFFVSTVLSTTGTSNTLVAFKSATLLLMIVWRSKLPTPNIIWGSRSIIATTQLSGVNSPFSLRFVAMISSSFLVWLLLDSRVVDVPMSSNPTVVTVAPHLTVVPAPPCNQAFERMRGTPTLLGGRPTGWRYVIRQQFADTPAMIRDARRHRRCRPALGVGQT